MGSDFCLSLLSSLNNLPIFFLSALMFGTSLMFLLLLLRGFGEMGVALYMALGTLVANIQVLKCVLSPLHGSPVALGTAVFSTLFFAADLLTEHYGKEAAYRSVALTFWAQLIFALLMMLTMGYAVCPGEEGIQEALITLFAPMPRFFVASLISFTLSQWVDIRIFDHIRRQTKGQKLWLRTMIASLGSSLLDTLLFSILAWIVFAPTPVSLHTLLFTYVLGTYGGRLITSLLSTPFIYLSYRYKPLP